MGEVIMNHTITNDIFGNNLLFLRTKYSLSRMALSKLLGTAAVLIAKWETCKIHPTLSEEMLQRICVIFQVSMEDLLCVPMHRLIINNGGFDEP